MNMIMSSPMIEHAQTSWFS